MLRGNHECSVINRVYGFFEECNRRYQSVRLWQTFQVLGEFISSLRFQLVFENVLLHSRRLHLLNLLLTFRKYSTRCHLRA